MYSPSHFCIVTPSPNWGIYFPDFSRLYPPVELMLQDVALLATQVLQRLR
ncbi:hypothetical protein SynMEDNS5_02680 [Synechococcus sp. MEDNS5]|nr:hypothetical protein SynMEDNS5_02680 [Synechococcus sp. MEDNS5]